MKHCSSKPAAREAGLDEQPTNHISLKIMQIRFLALFFLLPFFAPAQDFFAPSAVREVRIELPYRNWDWKLDSIKKNNPDARLLGTAYVDGQYFDSVGVRYKGNSSYFRTRKETYKKLPLNVKLNFKKRNAQIPGGHNTVRLSNAFLDPSFIRDPLMYEVVRRYMPAPQCNFAKVFVNEKFYGLYINTESIDSAFLRKHFGTAIGHIIKCDPDNWKKTRSQSGCPKGENASLAYLNDAPGCYDAFYEVEDVKAWQPLLRLIKILNKTPEKIETALNVDQALWMHALNNVMVNLDSYTGSLSHNYYLWADTFGVCHPIMWDFNMAFGGWRRDMSFSEMSDDQLIMYSPLAESTNAKRPLISQLLKNKFYGKIYLAHYKTIVNDFLASGELLKSAEKLMATARPAVQADSLKLYPMQTFNDALDKTMTNGPDHIIGIRQLMDARAKWLARHGLLAKPQPKITDNQAVVADSLCTVSVKLEGGKSAWLCHRDVKFKAFSRVPMLDDGQNGDATPGDGIFTARVEAAKIKHYYIIGENDDMAATLPERASYEFFEVK